MKNLFLILAVALLTGCAHTPREMVPATEVRFNPKTGAIEFVSPQDRTVVGLEFSLNTNGTYACKIQRLDSKMNPEVISMSKEAYVESIKAQGANNVQMMDKLIQLAPK